MALPGQAAPPQLRRVLSLWNLILYGIVIVTPAAAMFNFGVISRAGQGHVATLILIAMVPMLLTAVSYGQMARVYPSAGSAFTYVGMEMGPVAGYVIGWSVVLDYLLAPLTAIIWCSQQAHDFLDTVPYAGWVVIFSVVLTALNLQAVKVSARVHTGLVAAIGIVVGAFLIGAAYYVLGHPHDAAGFFTRPLYDPVAWNTTNILTGTSLAVLTYVGFDGVSTLAEEVENPRRAILIALVAACLVTGSLSALESYMAQLVWPAAEAFPNVDTAFTFVAQRVWWPLYGVVGVMLIIASFGSALGTQLAAARLLYGMGRSGALPGGFFANITPRHRIPANNVLLVGSVALMGALTLPLISGKVSGFELAANLLNFGALLGFMGVNAAAFVHYFVRADRKTFMHFLTPVVGFCSCLLLWANLSATARIVGGLWIAIGIGVGFWRTRGFRQNLPKLEFPREAID